MAKRHLHTRRWFAGACGTALAAAGLALFGCAKEPEPEEEQLIPITACIDTSADMSQHLLTDAQELGEFKENGIEVTFIEVSSGAEVLDTVNNGDALFGVVSQKTLAKAFGIAEPMSVEAIAALEQPEDSEKAKGYQALLIGNDRYLVKCPTESRLFVEALRAAGCREWTGSKKDWGHIDQEVWDSYFASLWRQKKIDCRIPAHHGYILDYLRKVKESGE